VTLSIAYNAQYCPKRHRAARKAHVAAFDNLAALHPVVIGVSEAGGYRRELQHVAGMRAIQPKGAAGRCALLIRNDVTVHDSGAFKLHGRKFVGRDVPGARVTGWTKARYIVWAIITDPDSGQVVVVGVEHPVPGQSHSDRAHALLAAEVAKSAAWVKAQKHAVDLMGDWNGTPGLALFKPLRAVAFPAFAASRKGSPIDGHWTTDGTAVATALDGYPSDHKPVQAVITWGALSPAPAPTPAPPAKEAPTVTETRAVDYSFARPAPGEIATKGYVAVLRYLGGSASKQLTKAEATALRMVGLKIGLVFEGTADRAKAGEAAGQTDARAAVADAAALGYPTDAPIFAAVDFDATPAQVSPYLQGWHAVLGDRAGVYAGIKVIDGVTLPWYWQTAAWSGGKLSPKAHIYQRTSMTHPISGCDENVICRPIPLWGGVVAPPGAVVADKPVTKPKRKPKPRPYNERQAITFARKALRNAKTAIRKARFRNALAYLLGRKKK
jgi:endonuclease/exonuclease/phosphatase family metal-dependent hydrolase